MNAGQRRFSAALPADPTSVARARRAVASFGADYGASSDKIALAVSEAVSNAVRHGYADRADEPVYVEADVDETAVVVRVHDAGTGLRFKPGTAGSGFGLPILQKVADQVAIESSDSGVSVELRFTRH